MKKAVVFFEIEGGRDKGPDGHRKDTMPVFEALRSLGWDAKVLFYRDEDYRKLLSKLPEQYDAYVSRINPGNIPGGEKLYLKFLDSLCKKGMLGMPHPETMLAFGSMIFSVFPAWAWFGGSLFIGVGACFLTTVIILPGIIGWIERK